MLCTALCRACTTINHTDARALVVCRHVWPWHPCGFEDVIFVSPFYSLSDYQGIFLFLLFLKLHLVTRAVSLSPAKYFPSGVIPPTQYSVIKLKIPSLCQQVRYRHGRRLGFVRNPGEISLSHNGVLFLEFYKMGLDILS